MARTRMALAAGMLVLAGACGPGNQGLETRTFQLENVEPNEVVGLIEPYVYMDRERAPGRLSYNDQGITVRELPENLERIASVLEEYDRPPPTVRLRFQIIEADGFSGTDPEIAHIQEELERLFNYDGYRLAASAVLETLEGGAVGQMVGGSGYQINGRIHQVRRTADGGFLTMEIGIDNLFTTTVRVPLGQTVVLGSGQIPWIDEGRIEAAILVVTSEVSG